MLDCDMEVDGGVVREDVLLWQHRRHFYMRESYSTQRSSMCWSWRGRVILRLALLMLIHSDGLGSLLPPGGVKQFNAQNKGSMVRECFSSQTRNFRESAQ